MPPGPRMTESPSDGADRGRVPDPDRPPPPPGDWVLARTDGPIGRDGAAAGSPARSRGRLLPGTAGIGLPVAAIAVYLGGQLLLQFAIGLGLISTGLIDPEVLDPERGGALLLGVVVASQTLGLLLVLGFLRSRGIRLGPLIGPHRPLGRLVGQGVGIGLLAIAGSTIVVSLLVALTGSEATPDQVLTGAILETPLQLVLAVLAAVVLAPLAEELLFRGLLHRALRSRYALVPATAVSSIVFALVHVDVLVSQPLAIVGLVLVGVILALAYERSGSLVVPVIIHAVHNAVTIVAVVVTRDLDPEVTRSLFGVVRLGAIGSFA